MLKKIIFFITLTILIIRCDKGKAVNGTDTVEDSIEYTIKLTANPDTLVINNDENSDIWALINKNDELAEDSTFVVFSASIGSIEPDSGYTKNGLVRAVLTPSDTIRTGNSIIIANTNGFMDSVVVTFIKEQDTITDSTKL